MRHEMPDRVPYWCQLSDGHLAINATLNGHRPATGHERLQAHCELVRRYGFDGILAVGPGALDDEDSAKANGNRWGELAMAHHLKVPFELLDPAAMTPTPPTYCEADFAGLRHARRYLGGDFFVGGFTTGPFARAVEWFGWPPGERAMLAMIDDPGRFKALVEYLTEYAVAFARAQVIYGKVDSIDISDPYSGSSFMSQETYRELVLPGQTRVIREVKALGCMTYLHVCGHIGDRLELMAQTGADGIECMDPPPLGNVKLADAKRRVGNRVFLKGNLDSVNVLLRGSDAEVERSVRVSLEAAMEGGGYILSTACSTAPEVPAARMQWIGELVAKHGCYH
jgi:uroporphyrinogen-III decarboxylase